MAKVIPIDFMYTYGVEGYETLVNAIGGDIDKLPIDYTDISFKKAGLVYPPISIQGTLERAYRKFRYQDTEGIIKVNGECINVPISVILIIKTLLTASMNCSTLEAVVFKIVNTSIIDKVYENKIKKAKDIKIPVDTYKDFVVYPMLKEVNKFIKDIGDKYDK